MLAAGGSPESPRVPQLGLGLSERAALSVRGGDVALRSGSGPFRVMMSALLTLLTASNKPHAGGAARGGNNRASWTTHNTVRIIDTWIRDGSR